MRPRWSAEAIISFGVAAANLSSCIVVVYVQRKSSGEVWLASLGRLQNGFPWILGCVEDNNKKEKKNKPFY